MLLPLLVLLVPFTAALPVLPSLPLSATLRRDAVHMTLAIAGVAPASGVATPALAAASPTVLLLPALLLPQLPAVHRSDAVHVVQELLCVIEHLLRGLLVLELV